MKIDNSTIESINVANEMYIPEYLSNSFEIEEIVNPSSSIPIMDVNNKPKYGIEFFDLIVSNLLLEEYDRSTYPISHNVAELASRLGYEGLRHCDILTCDMARKDFCLDAGYGRIPKDYHVYNYMLWINRYNHNALPIWFYYTLIPWLLIKVDFNEQFAYRSRLLVGIAYAYAYTKITDNNAEHCCDILRIQQHLLRLLKACCNHNFGDDRKKFLLYILSTLKEFSLLTLSTMIGRCCSFPEFKIVGEELRRAITKKHQEVIDTSYNNKKVKGVVNESTKSSGIES